MSCQHVAAYRRHFQLSPPPTAHRPPPTAHRPPPTAAPAFAVSAVLPPLLPPTGPVANAMTHFCRSHCFLLVDYDYCLSTSLSRCCLPPPLPLLCLLTPIATVATATTFAPVPSSATTAASISGRDSGRNGVSGGSGNWPLGRLRVMMVVVAVDCSKGAIAMSLGQKVVLSFNGYWGKRSE